jgi:cytoskeletal protein RodZ
VGAFGEKFRKQRELRGIELDAISNTTKISTRMLRALEDEHFDQLPGGVFNKGFVRAYARQIGLNEEEAVADYLTALRESQIQQQSILPDFRSPAAKPNSVAAPGPRNNALPSHDARPQNNNAAGDYTEDVQTQELRTENIRAEDRRTQGRRHEDRRNPDRINRDRVNNEDRLNEDRLNKDRPNEDRPHEAQTEDKDFSSSTNSVAHPHQRFTQKYPAGIPGETAAQSSAPVPWGKLALTLVVVTLALAFWNFRRHSQPAPVTSSNQSPPPASTPASAVTRSPGPANSLTVRPASPAKERSAGRVTPATISAPTTPHAKPAPPASAAPNRLAKPESPPASATAPTHSAKPTANPSHLNIKPPATHSAAGVGAVKPAAVKPPPTFTLLIRAQQTTWVSLTADGKPIAHETLIAPAQTSIRATHEIVVRAGNAAGMTFLLNGKEIPVQGSEGEVKTYIFNANGLRTAP